MHLERILKTVSNRQKFLRIPIQKLSSREMGNYSNGTNSENKLQELVPILRLALRWHATGTTVVL
jgi:hypothetical protein